MEESQLLKKKMIFFRKCLEKNNNMETLIKHYKITEPKLSQSQKAKRLSSKIINFRCGKSFEFKVSTVETEGRRQKLLVKLHCQKCKICDIKEFNNPVKNADFHRVYGIL